MNQARRRRFLLLAGALLISRASPAQQPKLWRIGFLTARTREAADPDIIQPFLQGMHELGYFEGKNVQYEWRFADGRYERLPSLAADLVRLNVDVIFASTTPTARAVQQATRTIPIVMSSVADPVGTGLVSNLARPGANITGVSNFMGDVSQKQFEIVNATIPNLSRVAVLMNRGNQSTGAIYKSIQAASLKVGLRLLPVEAQTPEEIERGFMLMVQGRAQALLVIADTFFTQQQRQIIQLADKFRMPAMFPIREFSEIGGLMSYGPNNADINHRAAYFVDRILKGAKPADLPVEQPTKLELVINLKTAKALGITIPQSLLLRADRVIE